MDLRFAAKRLFFFFWFLFFFFFVLALGLHCVDVSFEALIFCPTTRPANEKKKKEHLRILVFILCFRHLFLLLLVVAVVAVYVRMGRRAASTM